MSDPAKDVATFLNGEGAATLGTDLYYGKKPAEPGQYPMAVVLSTGGFNPEINATREHYQPTVQVVVTGEEQGYDAAQAFAEGIRDVLVDPVVFVSGDFTYYGSYQQGDIESLGYDANDRPEFTMNFRLYRRKENT